jgi:outer membrane protein assembly factor BamE (lipoprotein component of BamABCDE complex)
MTRLAPAAALALLFGCATVGRDFDATRLDWLRTGRTSKTQVLEALGQPWRVGSDAGDPTWTYGYYEYHALGESNGKDLVIRFAPDGTVKSYTLDTSFPGERKALDPIAVAP